VIPEYIDMASLYTDKRVYAVPCLLLPKQVLNAFLVMYQKDVDTTIDRSPEYLLFALQSYLINTDMAIIPLPKPLVTVSRSLDTSLPTEVMFTSLARYNTQKKWQTYRYGALLRSGVSASHEPIVDLPENSSDIMASDFDKMRLRQMVSLTAKKMRSIVTLRLKK
jgi:hypothetical protein